MNKRIRVALALLTLVCCSCNKQPETLVTGYDEQEVAAATDKARKEVDYFIGELSRGNGMNFCVKAPIEDEEGTEHFWLTDVIYRDGEFEGIIDNEPGIVKNVKFGQKWTIKKSEISDWMFMRDGKMHGNYTMRPLLKTLPEDEAEKMRSMLAEP